MRSNPTQYKPLPALFSNDGETLLELNYNITLGSATDAKVFYVECWIEHGNLVHNPLAMGQCKVSTTANSKPEHLFRETASQRSSTILEWCLDFIALPLDGHVKAPHPSKNTPR